MVRENRLGTAFRLVFLTLFAVTCLFPFLWMLGTALKPGTEALNNPSLLPRAGVSAMNWRIFADVWRRIDFPIYFFNSVKVSFFVVAGQLLIYSMAGFAFAKLRFIGRDLLFYGFLALLFVPSFAVVITLMPLEAKFGILNTHLGVILPMINGAAPFAIFLFRNYFKTIPHELFESAVLDGAGEYRIYATIFLPLAKPALATLAIMNFLSSWNALLWPLVCLRDEKLFTLPLGLMYLNTSMFVQYNVLMAGGLIALAPTIVVFLFMQKYYIAGLTAGAVKA
ncbi:MAG: carbohydrate ABC transporter permease [Bacteroidota bacterium]